MHILFTPLPFFSRWPRSLNLSEYIGHSRKQLYRLQRIIFACTFFPHHRKFYPDGGDLLICQDTWAIFASRSKGKI